jgi:cytochrome d ubiquinol oxidase subunit II
MLEALPLVFVFAGVVLYAVLGGADLGAGFWQLTAGRGDGARIREFAHHAMGPVWEANHVWLIFVITVFWTAYPKAFGSIASTLAIPLFIALFGIVFRGAAYALRPGATTEREAGAIDTIFALSSILVPFALGAAVGAIATNRVPVGNTAGHLGSSWLNPTSIFIGVLAVAVCAYLAAVYLAADAAHDRDVTLEQVFRSRALGSGIVAGAIAILGVVVVNGDNRKLFHSLLNGRALVAVAVSGLAGLITLALVQNRRYELARYCAALAVGAIVAGWGLARWPTILPGLTVHHAAAGHDTLVCLVVAVIAGGIIVFPALAVLFRLAVAGRFRTAELDASELKPPRPDRVDTRPSGRLAVACLIAGAGLLTLADADWAHAVGVACVLVSTVLAFRAIIMRALDEDFEASRRSARS